MAVTAFGHTQDCVEKIDNLPQQEVHVGVVAADNTNKSAGTTNTEQTYSDFQTTAKLTLVIVACSQRLH